MSDDLTAKRVLWIDEESDLWVGVRLSLVKLGFQVQAAGDIRGGEAALRRSGGAFQGVLLLDALVPLGPGESSTSRYPGLKLWDSLDKDEKRRTLVFSVVPYEDIVTGSSHPPGRESYVCKIGARPREVAQKVASLLFNSLPLASEAISRPSREY